MNFVNKEKLYFIGEHPGRVVVFLIGLTHKEDLEKVSIEFSHSFSNSDVFHLENFIISYNDFYIEAMLNYILSLVISTTNYILIPDWFTKTEYELISSHSMLYTITLGFENDLDEDIYDLVLTKDKPVGEQLVQYINKLKEGEKQNGII